MKRVICAVFDLAISTFGQPLFVAGIGGALRSFQDEVNRPSDRDDNPLNRHPADFELWYLGEFDDTSGEFTLLEGERRRIARAVDIKEIK